MGVYCVWDLPPWHESYEEPSGGESRVLPQHGCPLWNAELPCSSSPCTQPHHCQACSQPHRLTQCPVNSFLTIPTETLANRSDLSVADRLAFMRWYGDVFALLKFHSSFRVWKLPLREQLSQAQLLILPSGVMPSTANSNSSDGLLPCDALVYIDWQNIKVPLYAVSSFMSGLCKFVLDGRPGVRAIRAINVLLDRDKKSDVADYLDKLSQTYAVPIHVVHVDARKFQAIDSKLTLMMRTEPRPAVNGKCSADLVCVVSGDSDFSPDMSRLVLLGHRVLVMYNAQARLSFKQNALWEAGVDFMDLPELTSYRTQQLQRRLERRHAVHAIQRRGIFMNVTTMSLYGGNLQSRLSGLHGACMDCEGHALLITDELHNRLWRFVLPDTPRQHGTHASSLKMDKRNEGSDVRHTQTQLSMGKLELLIDCITEEPIQDSSNLHKSRHSKTVDGQSHSFLNTDDVVNGVHVLSNPQLCAPKEVVIDPSSGLIFVCDTGNNRVAVWDRAGKQLYTLRPTVTRPGQKLHQPRHLFIDVTRQRLWLTDLATHQLCFYDLRRRLVLNSANMTAPYHVVELDSTEPNVARPTSKCLAANQVDLVYCDEGRRAFFLLSESKLHQPGGLPNSADKNDYAVAFRSILLLKWIANHGSNVRDLSTPLPSYHSLQLDRDGSYLFADATTKTIKRLVSLRNSVTDGDGANSSHWEVRLVAGKGQGGFADGDALDVRFKFPVTLVVDHSEMGSIFIADQGNRLLRKLHVAHETDGVSVGMSGRSNNSSLTESQFHDRDRRGVRSLNGGLSDSSRSRWKTRPCKPFQQGDCHFQADSDKCGFIHECMCCSGPHSERDCKHKELQDQYPYLIVQRSTNDAADSCSSSSTSSINNKISCGSSLNSRFSEISYMCQICCEPCGSLEHTKQHVDSDAHEQKRARFVQSMQGTSSLFTTTPTPPHSQSPTSFHDSSTKLADKSDFNDLVLVSSEQSVTTRITKQSMTASTKDISKNVIPENIPENAFNVVASSSVSSLLTPADTDDSSTFISNSSTTLFRCELCHTNFNSRIQMEQHEQGRTHRNRSVRAAAGIPLSVAHYSSESSLIREPDVAFSCPVCVKDFQVEVDAHSTDRRPRALPCGHSVCLQCLHLAKVKQVCLQCGWPFQFDNLTINSHMVEQMQAHSHNKAQAERKRLESDRIARLQHDAFQRAFPYMKQDERRNPQKEPFYLCTLCGIMAGPLHRALAHTNTNEHKKQL